MPPVKRKRAADFFSVGSDDNKSDDEDKVRDTLEENNNNDGSSSEEEEENPQDSEDEEAGRTMSVKKTKSNEIEQDDDDYDESEVEDDENTPSGVQPISKKQLEKREKRIKKTGVVYISRIPPFMKPEKLRHILTRFGEVNRIFLVPEDAKSRARRVKYGGNRKKCYTEGWAEFKKKKHAKVAAETLNGNIIGGKKGNFFHDDILNVKYLHKFKWSNLTEQITAENQSRQEKMRAEISQATRENRTFIDNVEKSKMIKGIQEKRAQKDRNSTSTEPIRRSFDQRKTTTRRAATNTNSKDNNDKKSNNDNNNKSLSGVLSKVF